MESQTYKYNVKKKKKTLDIYDVSLIMLRKVLVSKNYLIGTIKKHIKYGNYGNQKNTILNINSNLSFCMN